MRNGLRFLLALGIACGSTPAVPPPPAAVDAGAPMDSGEVCALPCEAGERCVEGVCAGTNVIYVSEQSGIDFLQGDSPSRPKRTISNAVRFAKKSALVGYEIHVCRGTYIEREILLDYPVSILGGYDCSTWRRPSDFGKAGGFGVSQESIIKVPPNTAAFALVVLGAGLTRATRVEGFTITGNEGVTSTTDSGSVYVDEASITIANNVLFGGSTSGGGIGGSALRLVGGNADVFDNVIRAGEGTGMSLGSLAVSLGRSHAHLHDNRIDAGSGTALAGQGAVGILVTDGSVVTGENAIERNDITWGTGHAPVTAALGVLAVYSDIDLLDNKIRGGKGECTGTGDCTLQAAVLNGMPTNRVRVRGNRMYAGEMTPNAARNQYIRGLEVTTFASAEIVNNALHGGLISGATGAVANSAALTLARVGSATVANNTTYVGTHPVQSIGVVIYDAQTPTTTGTYSIRNHVIVGRGRATDLGFVANTCSVTSLQGVALIGMGATASSACNGTSTYVSLSSYESFVTLNGGVVGGNSSLPASSSSLLGFDATTAGTVMMTTGFPLAKHGDCALVAGGQTLLELVPTDITGKARTAPFSIGAWEEDDCVATPH